MAGLRVKVDKGGLERKFRAAGDALGPPRLTEALETAAEVFRRGITRRAPTRTGRLGQSFVIRRVSGSEVEVSSGLVYARPHEEGAFIRAKRGRALAFRSGGGMRYLKWVRLRPRPYVAPTFASDAEEAFRAFADHVERAIDS